VIDAVVAIYGIEVLVGRVLGILVTRQAECVGKWLETATE
jgi:DNA-binding transcriptional regulator GbsR (MarR family)